MKKREYPSPDGWVMPSKRGYHLACCDCGLVHRMDFDVVEDGAGPAYRRAPRKYRAIFRADRAVRETARYRKAMK